MRLTDEGVIVEGPRGHVLLRKEADGITATPIGLRPMKVSGYAKELRREAIQRARKQTPSWSPRSDGSIQIQDQAAFYEETFNPSLRCLEVLRRWLQSPEDK